MLWLLLLLLLLLLLQMIMILLEKVPQLTLLTSVFTF